jgi:activating signal cointegrator 1
MADLHALSFLQPWLWAILSGHKPVENREWRPRPKIIGKRIALHASRGYDHAGADFVRRVLPADALSYTPNMAALPRGAILGTAVVVGAVEIPEVPKPLISPTIGLSPEQVATVHQSPWTFGPWAWLLADMTRLATPIACRGALGLWRVPEDIAERIAREEAARAL